MTTPTRARVRNLINWVTLSTPLGLGIARLGKARIWRGEDGIWLAEHYTLKFPIAGAFTVGSVLIACGRSWDELESRHPGTMAHETNHTWQWAACLGVGFLPLYSACMGWSWLRTGDRASRNFFERHADLALGGYREAPVRPWKATLSAFSGRVAPAAKPTEHRGESRADGEDA